MKKRDQKARRKQRPGRVTGGAGPREAQPPGVPQGAGPPQARLPRVPFWVPNSLRRARSYPIVGCWERGGWQADGLAVVVVVREAPYERVVLGVYLVDCQLLGVKNALYRTGVPASEVDQAYLATLIPEGRPVQISPALAHEIIYGAIEYAARFGFQPHRDFGAAQLILDPPDAHPRTGKVEFGRDGKPFYVAGPYDDVSAILDKLARTAGEGNFHYFLPIEGSTPVAWDLALEAGDEEDSREYDS